MLFTEEALESFGAQWATIQKFCSSSHRQPGIERTFINEAPADEFCNLAVVLAFSLLDEVLGELARQGAYTTIPGAMLGRKMNDSHTALPWCDLEAVEAAKARRNRLAHSGDLISREDCLKILGKIGMELRAFEAVA